MESLFLRFRVCFCGLRHLRQPIDTIYDGVCMKFKKLLVTAFGASVLCVGLSAHATYKWVGADGKITYSDVPPPAEGKLLRGPSGAPPQSAAEGDSGLPYALKQAVAKYPVVLYSANDCSPCKMAREVLTKRGVPFSERLITSGNDAEQFKKLGFTDLTMPSITVGKERSVGFEASAYDRLLDSAGYPRSSVLPSTYKAPAAEAMAKASTQVRVLDSDGNKMAKAGDTRQEQQAKQSAERLRSQEAAKAAEQNPTSVRF
jgi:glutaredoxin